MSSIETVPPAQKPRQWNATDQLPQNEDLTIELRGLFSICYLDDSKVPAEDQGHCQIGVFNQDPKHKLMIEIEGGACSGGVTTYEYTHEQVNQLANEKFRIGIVGASGDVEFLQRDEWFNRATTTDPEDFRWLIDCETPDLYDELTQNKQPHYGPKLFVKNGTFFTGRVTRTTFKFVEQSPSTAVRLLGGVASQTSARIKLDPGQEAKFEFKDPNGADQSCTFGPGSPARITIVNLCHEDGAPCTAGDFHLHFGSFDPPSNMGRFDVVLDQSAPVRDEVEGPNPAVAPGPDITEESDEAPCHAMGYGLSGSGTNP